MVKTSWTQREFEKQAGEENAHLTIIHGKIYDISSDFLEWHPGGSVAATQVRAPYIHSSRI